MKSIFLFPRLIAIFLVTALLCSCTDNGKKVTFTSHKGEVYYKGDGVTEADAKATGKFLEENDVFLKDDKQRSVQIVKKDGHIQLRIVTGTEFEESKEVDERVALIGAKMSRQVFNNIPVDVIYTDDKFNDKKTIAFNPASINVTDLSTEIKNMKKKDYMANTLYYAPEVEESAADTIVNYLVKSDFFSSKSNNDILLSKTTGNGAHFRFPVKASFANDEGLLEVESFARSLKTELFEGIQMEFEVLDENMKSVKTFNFEAGSVGGAH